MIFATLLVYILLLVTVLQISYAFFFLKPLVQLPAHKPVPDVLPAVSVVICARNEAQQLARYLPAVLQQDYPDDLWEVILVNDASTDQSSEILAALQLQYSRLKVVSVPVAALRELPGKKQALNMGIAHAAFDLLLLTDADCLPATDQWLREMVYQQHASGKQIVLGYGAYHCSHGLLNRFVRWETVHTFMQYGSYASHGMPYMGVGRNLMYEKYLYYQARKDDRFWTVYKHTPSGDDDLLIGQIAGNNNTTILATPAAKTLSAAPESWKAWWRQKTRHVSTGKLYAPALRRLLGVYGLSHGLYWLLGPLVLAGSLIAACTRHQYFAGFSFFTDACFCPDGLRTLIILAWLGFWMRLVLYWILAAAWYRQLKEPRLYLFFPLFDWGWAIYNVLLSPYIFLKNRQEWK